MKKRYAALGMALVILGSTLAGCSGSSGNAAEAQTGSELLSLRIFSPVHPLFCS